MNYYLLIFLFFSTIGVAQEEFLWKEKDSIFLLFEKRKSEKLSYFKKRQERHRVVYQVKFTSGDILYLSDNKMLHSKNPKLFLKESELIGKSIIHLKDLRQCNFNMLINQWDQKRCRIFILEKVGNKSDKYKLQRVYMWNVISKIM